MIHSFDIRNFRCFKRLEVENCSRLNVIVGDNGSGKTALLESIFLPLATSTEVALRFRQQRGLDGNFSGPRKKIEDAIWGDFYHNYSFSPPISITLSGDGTENRSLLISKGKSEQSIPLLDPAGDKEATMSASVVFTWKDSKGVEFEVVPRFTASGIQFPETGEDMPNFFHFAAGRGVSAVENAGRFSELSRAKRDREFIKVFSNEYKFIDDISIEVHAGQPVLYATLKGVDEKIPLANVSHGINRLVGIMLAIASRPQSIVLVDEIESGIYYKHKTAIWRSILTFMRKYDSQLFVTTHDIEWLKALVEAAGKKNDDISLWRLKRNRKHPVLDQFKGETLKHGIEFGQEVR